MVIFHSYVSLPEGTLLSSYGPYHILVGVILKLPKGNIHRNETLKTSVGKRPPSYFGYRFVSNFPFRVSRNHLAFHWANSITSLKPDDPTVPLKLVSTQASPDFFLSKAALRMGVVVEPQSKTSCGSLSLGTVLRYTCCTHHTLYKSLKYV